MIDYAYYHLPALNPPHTGQHLIGSATGAPVKVPTWGDAPHWRKRAQVTRLEPATQTKRFGEFRGSPIDGELYTADCRRGNILARVIRNGTPARPLSSTRKLHPFAGAKRGSGLTNALPIRVHNPQGRHGTGKAAENATEYTNRPVSPILAA